MSSSETRRSLVWLGAAVVFFLAVLWWKRDSIFGDDGPKPDPNGKTQEGPNGAAKGTEEQPFVPVRNDDPNAATFAIRVSDAKTGKPIEGARVVVYTRQAKLLADELTDARGSAATRPKAGSIHAAVAFHRDYAIRAVISSESPVDIRLTPVQMVEVHVGNLGPAQKEWHKTSNPHVSYKAARTFSPILAKPDYFQFKMYEHMGLRERLWPFASNPIEIPQYLPGIAANLRFHTAPSLPNHLDKRGLRDVTVPKLANEPWESPATDAPADAMTYGLRAPPLNPHALIARYERQPGQDGVLMLHLAHLDRDEGSPTFGDMSMATFNPSTYEESAGTATFKVYELQKTVVYPKLLHFPKGKPREVIPCNPIDIDGLTEGVLTPLKTARLVVELTGQRVAGEQTSLVVLDDRYEPATQLTKYVREQNEVVWDAIHPMTHRFVAHDSGFASGLHEVVLKPGEDRTVQVEMKPACAVTIVMDGVNLPDLLVIHDKTTGHTWEFLRALWPRYFEEKTLPGDRLSLSKLRQNLFLARGTYEFGLKFGGSVTKKEVVLDGATKEIRFE